MRSRDLFLFFFRLHFIPNFLYYKHQEVNMITNFKNTSITEELTIMAMADIDERPSWEEDYQRELEARNVRDYEERLKMEAQGFILNPEYDEDHAYMTWKYDREPDFACKCYVTPAELEEFRHLQQVIAFGWTLFGRLLTEVEEQEDSDMRMMGHYHYEDLRVA